MHPVRSTLIALFLFSCLGVMQPDAQQQRTPPALPGQRPPTFPNPGDSFGGDPFPPELRARMLRNANNERQKRLVEDTNRLLQLATQLKEEVDKTNKDILSVDVIKKADEIEKLAHSVKERMKG